MPKKGRKATRMTPGFTGPFKGDPQPGTLFDVRALDQLPGNVAATRERPGPRGYSPARLAEIRQSFDTANVSGGGKTEVIKPIDVALAPGFAGRMNETGHQYGPSSWDPDNPRMGRARSRILDTLSRSTIPVGDEMTDSLAGLGRIETRRQGERYAHLAGMYKAHGNYDQPDEEGFRRHIGPTITMFAHDNAGTAAALHGKDEGAEQTLLHEIGHHDSYTTGHESSAYSTPHEMATEEARADKFAVTHFRRDPRNKGEYDPREHTYMARGQHRQWDAGFEGHYGAPGVYEQRLPASMHPPSQINRNLRQEQFEQPELDEEEDGGRGGEVFWGEGVEKPYVPPARHY